MFRKYDAGADQKLRHERGDCTVRALTVATGMPYEDAWTMLYGLQAEYRHCSFRLFEYLREKPELFGIIRYIPTPAKRGVRRTKVGDLTLAHPTGRYIVQAAHHATAIVNGMLLDTWDCGRKAVYGAWEIRQRY